MVQLHYRGKTRSAGSGSSSLLQRRRIHLGRRLVAAICLGVAIFSLLQTIGGVIGHRDLVLAARPIARGDRIAPTMIRTISIPGSWTPPGSFSAPDQPLGQVAQIDIEEGRPLLDIMLGRYPIEPPGTTSVELNLTSSIDSLVPGDLVKLLAPGDCQANQVNPPASFEGRKKTDPNQAASKTANMREHPFPSLPAAISEETFNMPGTKNSESCILVEEGLIINLPKTSKGTGIPANQGESAAGQEPSRVVLALKPFEATRILSMNPSVPLIAIRLGKSSQPTPSNLHKRSSEDKYPDNEGGN